MRPIRFWLPLITVATQFGAGLCSAAERGLLLAQQQAPGGGTRIVSGKNWVLEICVVIVLVGIAGYAVCRSSRRA